MVRVPYMNPEALMNRYSSFDHFQIILKEMCSSSLYTSSSIVPPPPNLFCAPTVRQMNRPAVFFHLKNKERKSPMCAPWKKRALCASLRLVSHKPIYYENPLRLLLHSPNMVYYSLLRPTAPLFNIYLLRFQSDDSSEPKSSADSGLFSLTKTFPRC